MACLAYQMLFFMPSECVRFAANLCIGWLGGARGHYKEAEKYYRKALKTSPESVEAHLRLAHVLKHGNDTKESLRLLEWTLAHSDEPPARLVAHLDVHRRHRQCKLAIRR